MSYNIVLEALKYISEFNHKRIWHISGSLYIVATRNDANTCIQIVVVISFTEWRPLTGIVHLTFLKQICTHDCFIRNIVFGTVSISNRSKYYWRFNTRFPMWLISGCITRNCSNNITSRYKFAIIYACCSAQMSVFKNYSSHV